MFGTAQSQEYHSADVWQVVAESTKHSTGSPVPAQVQQNTQHTVMATPNPTPTTTTTPAPSPMPEDEVMCTMSHLGPFDVTASDINFIDGSRNIYEAYHSSDPQQDLGLQMATEGINELKPGEARVIMSSNYPDVYPDDLHQEWSFKGLNVQTLFHVSCLDFETVCPNDVLYIYEAGDKENRYA
ncbi:uncharacterized protein LOC143019420 [Oratosquilla oratoria]|uniref:uncharacterized protein LOC143019420 n=1 Tax=Oratosquilla oratoria TaxID=337810 RepID=UPI003F76A196